MTTYLLDTETTGVKEPRLVEAAWAECPSLHMDVIMEVFCQRYNPGKPIEFGAMATHHITDENVADCPPASEFKLLANCEYLIGHNVDFDYQVALSCGPQPAPKRICTLALSRDVWPQLDSHSLFAVAYSLNRQATQDCARQAHSAETDLLICAMIVRHLVQQLGVRSWEALWQASEAARVPKAMPFGKHRGMPIGDVPRDYRQWLLRQADVDPYLVTALKRSLGGKA